MLTIYAIACVVLDKKKVLLLKRAPNKKFFPNKWAVVAAAPLRKSTNMEEIALREIKDELGVEGKIVKKGEKVIKKMGGFNWEITPFAASLKSKEITLNEEHIEAEWVSAKKLDKYDLVPGIAGAIKSLF